MPRGFPEAGQNIILWKNKYFRPTEGFGGYWHDSEVRSPGRCSIAKPLSDSLPKTRDESFAVVFLPPKRLRYQRLWTGISPCKNPVPSESVSRSLAQKT